MSNHLPEEVWAGIFTRLPVKTLLQIRIVDSCNGLICLNDDNDFDTSGIILWNPSIKRFLNLPNPRVTSRSYGSYMYVLGFGYDEKNDDYKVVRVAYKKGRSGRDLIPPEVELYSLNSRSWRSFNAGAPPYGIFGYTWLQAFVNGAVHWVGYDPCVVKGNESCGLIVAFDLSDEVFREVMLPSCLEQHAWDVYITVFWGKLAVLHYDYGAHKNFCSVWVMEEYGLADSWKKLYTVDLRGGLRNLIGFLRNDEVIGVTIRGKLLSYDLITSRINNLRLRGAVGGFHVGSYMESLVLLEAESAALARESITSGNEQEEEQATDLHAVKNRNDEFDDQEKLESFLSLRISEQNYSAYLCCGFSEQELSAKNSEEWVKELVPEANCDGWEND
ncbi:F-box/kelch-repeat protein At3g06240-like isoform X2 [Coffea eugenioides]|uniref:F-box/kelch-repeat protein At3g06240-like isoform X2 n=1 Tax=Coffea eugenioides TaxID=49369 RepID=UPI000F60A392|nr:F-box/kelch-repeat protein At3g06240-like isoform X2 [Coffea eugenioides]